jgi:hypothetical protein
VVLLRFVLDIAVAAITGDPQLQLAKDFASTGVRAALFGAAQLLADGSDHWNGAPVALFRPAEETADGARAMLDDGLVRPLPGVDVALELGDHNPVAVLVEHVGHAHDHHFVVVHKRYAIGLFVREATRRGVHP